MQYGHEYEFEQLDEVKKTMPDYMNYYNNKQISTKLKGLTTIICRH